MYTGDRIPRKGDPNVSRFGVEGLPIFLHKMSNNWPQGPGHNWARDLQHKLCSLLSCRKWWGIWGALGRTLPGGWWRWSFPSTLPWWGQSGVLCPVQGSSVQKRLQAPEANPAETDKDDEGTGTPLLWGKAGEVRPVQSQDETTERRTQQSPEVYNRRNVNWVNIYLTTKEVTVT